MNDTSLSTFTINGVTATNYSTIYIYGNTINNIVATPTNPTATRSDIVIVDLIQNVLKQISFNVTSNGYTQNYEVNVFNNTSLGVFTINDVNVSNNQTIYLSKLLYSPDDIIVTATPNNPSATRSDIVIADIENGKQITFSVSSNDDIEHYSVTVYYYDTSLSTFTINGVTATNNFLIFDSAIFDIVATPNDPSATRSDFVFTDIIDYETMIILSKEITFNVTSNGYTQNYIRLLIFNINPNDTIFSLKTFTINEIINVRNGQTLYIFGNITIEAIPEDSTSTRSDFVFTDIIENDSVIGNTITFNVISENGFIKIYTVHVIFSQEPTSNDNSLSTFTINGSDVNNGDTTYVSSNSIDIVAIKNDDNATVSDYVFTDMIENDIVIGNTITFTVTAENGNIEDYQVNVYFYDTSLSKITINEKDFYTVDYIYISANTIDFSVTPKVSNATHSDFVFTDMIENDIVIGNNITFTVTNSIITTNYFVQVYFYSTSLSTFTINESDVNNGDTTYVSGNMDLEVVAIPNDSESTVSDFIFTDIIDNISTGVIGKNITFTVTATNGNTEDYHVIVYSYDTSLSNLTINGIETEYIDGGGRTILISGDNIPIFTPTPTDPNATISNIIYDFTKYAYDIVNGGEVSFYVTNGLKNEYYYYGVILKKDTRLETFSIKGSNIFNGGTITISDRIDLSDIVIVCNDQSSYSEPVITPLSSRILLLTFTVTNENGYTEDYKVIINGKLVCFKEGSKILTDQGYRLIEELRPGDLVKTALNDYKPIVMMGKKEIYHPADENRIKDQLYQCSPQQYPELTEDLIITGCHCILVNNLTNEQRTKSIEINGKIYITGNKYRLPACVDERTSVYDKKGNHTIYHLALENEHYHKNYGIYANGLLVETCSKRYLKELSNMELHE
jgi:hypothetical protein